MTRKEEIIEMLEVLKKHGINKDTGYLNIHIDSFIFVIDESIKELKKESALEKIREDINNLTVYYTTKAKGINLISQRAVNRVIDKYKRKEL